MQDRFRFRCWCVNKNQWETGKVYLDNEGRIYDEFHRVKEETHIINFCTGLNDKNGKLIYEGDIIKIPTQCNKELHGNYSLQEVVWRNGYWIISYISSETGRKLPRGFTSGFLHDYWSEEFKKEFMFSNEEMFCKYDTLEVIGNIYENKELLGEEK